MRQAIIHEDLSVSFELEAPIPKPRDNEVIIKAVTAGINPIDRKGAREADAVALHGELENSMHRAPGKDFAGYVHSVGTGVFQLKVGDRVTAVNHSSGSAEYSVGPVHITALLPPGVSFEEAATYPLAYITAALALFRNTPAPTPWNPARAGIFNPLLIYSASSAVGSFAVKLAALANIHPIIAIAGSSSMLDSLLDHSKGDIFLSYRDNKVDELASKIREAAPSGIRYAVDVAPSESTMNLISQVLNLDDSYLALGLAVDPLPSLPAGTKSSITFAPGLWEPKDNDGPDGECSSSVSLRVRDRGLNDLSRGLREVKEGKNAGKKYVYKIDGTDWTSGPK
jgi:NADPH:quinone reductase